MSFASTAQFLLMMHISACCGFTYIASDSILNGVLPSNDCNEFVSGRMGNRKSLSAKAAVEDSAHQRDYEFLDCGNLKRLERFGGCMIYCDLMSHHAPSYYDLSGFNLSIALIDVTVVRSCPSAIWPRKISSAEWEKSTNVVYDGSSGKNGKWTGLKNVVEKWEVEFGKTKTNLSETQIKKSVQFLDTASLVIDKEISVRSDDLNDHKITFTLSCSDQGQVGVFPEQQDNWKWISDSIRESLQTEIAKNNQKEKERNPDTVISEDYVQVIDYNKLSVNSRKNPPKIRTSNDKNSSKNGRKIPVEGSVKNIPMRKILNGFAYTGGSSLAALLACDGSDRNVISSPSLSLSQNDVDVDVAVNIDQIPIIKGEVEENVQIQVQVVHLDAAKSSVQWALRNAAACGLVTNDGSSNESILGSEENTSQREEEKGGEEEERDDVSVNKDLIENSVNENLLSSSSSSSSSSTTPYSARWITDDCLSFLDREIRRGNKYDGLIFDPPAFGRASNGKIWKIEKDLPVLVEELIPKLLSEKPLFVLLSCHDVAWPPERLAESLSVAMSTVARNAMLLSIKALKKNKTVQPVSDKTKKNNKSKEKDSDKKNSSNVAKKSKIILSENDNRNIKSIVVAGGILEYGPMILTPNQFLNNVRKSEIGNSLPLGGFARWSAVSEEE